MVNKKSFRPRTLVSVLIAMTLAAGSAWSQATPDPQREKRIQWWREARFGMFIHWGLYAVPAGEWKGQQIQGIGEWIMNRARIPVAEYEQLAKQFNPVKFNAKEWVGIAKDAGMKYIVITSKHHDGFAMFGSKVSPYNIVDATPFHRDPMKELAAACRDAGIRLCFYYSHAQDWHERDGAGNNWDFPPNPEKNFARYFEDKAKPQVRELLTNYGPIGLIWFDTPQLITKEQAVELTNLVHSLQPNCLVSGRVGFDAGDYDSAGDNQLSVGAVKRDWETPVTLNDTWGFKKDDNNWKPAPVLLRQLVRTASRSGNYLLNVGPTSEGVIPQPSVDRLREVGKWVKANSESIYGTGPSPFPYNQEFGYLTTKPGKLYVHLMEWPGQPLTIYGVKNKVARAYLLADSQRKALGVKQESKPDLDYYSTTVQLPKDAPDQFDSVVVLEMTGRPDVVTSLSQQPDGTVLLDAYLANLHKGSGDSGITLDRRGVLTRWVDTKDWVSWEAKVFRPGAFDVVLTTAMGRGFGGGPPQQRPAAAGAPPRPPFQSIWEGGHRVVFDAAGAQARGALADDGKVVDPSNPMMTYVTSKLGQVRIEKAGSVQFALKPESLVTQNNVGLALASVKLVPVQ